MRVRRVLGWLAGMFVIAGVVMLSASLALESRTAGRVRSIADQVQAEQLIQARIRIHPECPRAHFAYAQLLSKQGRIDQARRELREAERLQPGLSFAPADVTLELARKLGMNQELAPGPSQFHY